jgi:hypothetical protein
MCTRKQEALPSDPQGLDWRRPVQKELIGLFDELAAFNERIAELTKLGHQSHAMDVLKAQAISLAAQIDELRCILIVPKRQFGAIRPFSSPASAGKGPERWRARAPLISKLSS